ncbi:MAG: hypothetical protein LUE17_16410 [Planctomycetaceae bacterium]|nr:hypothetical protein [Planctomycetaceae bacterium]
MLLIVIMLTLMVPISTALGVDIPAITVADFTATPASPEAHWFWSLLASDAATRLWLWVTTTGVALLAGWLKWKGSRKERALLCLAGGVRETYEEYVRAVKRGNEDGKLTEDERREAVRQAIERGKQYAICEGFDLLKVLAKDSLPVWVDAIVRKIKGEAAQSKNPLPISQPPLPDLAPSLSSGA